MKQWLGDDEMEGFEYTLAHVAAYNESAAWLAFLNALDLADPAYKRGTGLRAVRPRLGPPRAAAA